MTPPHENIFTLPYKHLNIINPNFHINNLSKNIEISIENIEDSRLKIFPRTNPFCRNYIYVNKVLNTDSIGQEQKNTESIKENVCSKL